MSRYLTLRCEVPLELAETTAYFLHEEGAEGVEVQDDEVRPPPGAPVRPEGKAWVTGFFGGEADAESIKARMESLVPGALVTYERLDEEPWTDSWKLHFRPVKVRDSFWVVPPWEEVPEGVSSVVIEPGMAFGTGGHETTALCLDFLADLVRPDRSVLDLGCGSGILGISAAHLGAGRVLMIDNDPVAVEVARKNALENGHPEIEASGIPVEELEESFDLVLANILAVTLVDLAPAVVDRMRPGGSVVLSGITVDQAAEVRATYEALGLVFREERSQGEWSAILLERPR